MGEGLLSRAREELVALVHRHRRKERELLQHLLEASRRGDEIAVQQLLSTYSEHALPHASAAGSSEHSHSSNTRRPLLNVNGTLGNTFTALHLASLNGHVETCKLLLEEGGANPNLATDFGGSALHFAARNGHEQVCALLIGLHRGAAQDPSEVSKEVADTQSASTTAEIRRADIDAQTKKGYTALHWACRNGHTSCVRLLLHAGANPSLKNNYGDSCLHWACRSGHTDTALAVLLYGQSSSSEDGSAPSSWAGSLKECKGANSMTPLHWAALNGQGSTAAALLAHGAMVGAVDNDGWNALHFAARFGHPHVASEVLSAAVKDDEAHGLNLSDLIFANNEHFRKARDEALEGPSGTRMETVNEMSASNETGNFNSEIGVAHNQDIDSAGETLLRHELRQEQTTKHRVHVVQELHARDKFGHAPLHLAAMHGHTATVQVLIELGANIYEEVPDEDIGTVLLPPGPHNQGGTNQAASALLPLTSSVVLTLRDMKVNDSDGLEAIAREGTALFMALKRGHTETVKLLLRAHILISQMESPPVLAAFIADLGQSGCTKQHTDYSTKDTEGHMHPAMLDSASEARISQNDSLAIIKDNDIDWEGAQRIGAGSYGEVYKAKWTNSPVAVKGHNNVELLTRNEAAMMASLRHPHTVLFLGACTRATGEVLLVSEFMEGGTLFNLLHRSRRPIANRILVKLAYQIASGLCYLHSRTPPIIHRDLSANNILLDRSLTYAKISDFGLSRIKSDCKETLSNSCGTVLYQPPEVFLGGCVDECVDTYSFGVLLWEIVTRSRPWKPMRQEAVSVKLMLEGTSATKKHLVLPKGSINWLSPSAKELMLSCWAQSPDARPTSQAIVKIMEEAYEFARIHSPSSNTEK